MGKFAAIVFLLGAGTALAPVAGQFGPGQMAVAPESAAPAAAAAATPPVAEQPTISLAMLGMRDGLALAGRDGRSNLVFRVAPGPWLGSAKLVLPYRSSGEVGSQPMLTLFWRHRILGRFALADEGTIVADVPLAAFADGIATFALSYDAGSTPQRCANDRMNGNQLTLDRSGGLVLTPAQGQLPPVSTVASLIGDSPAVIAPANFDPGQAAAILSVFAARGDSRVTFGSGPSDHSVTIAGGDQPALRSTGPTALAIGGRDPAGAARALFSGAGPLPLTSTIDRLVSVSAQPRDLTLADLGADMSTVQVGHEYRWTIPLPASRLPGGRSIARLAIDVATPAGGHETRISAWINDVMIGGAAPSPSGITHLDLAVPGGIVNSMNWLAVRVDRDVQEDCDTPVYPVPAQLLPSSKVVLGEPEQGGDFRHFVAASNGGVTVVLPGRAALPLAARAAASLLSSTVPISVSFGHIPASGPVILIADSLPSGLTSPASLGGRRVRIADKDGKVRLDVPRGDDDTVVQMVKNGDRPMLWIRPAQSGAVPASMYLSQGNFAIVAATGTVQALSTQRDRLAVPTEFVKASWWDQNKGIIYLFGGLLAGSLLAGFALRPSRKRAKPGQAA